MRTLIRQNYFCSALVVHIWFADECDAGSWKPGSFWITLLSIYNTYKGQVLELNVEEFWSIITQICQLPALKKRANEDCCLPAPNWENKASGKLQSCPLPLLQMEDRLHFPQPHQVLCTKPICQDFVHHGCVRDRLISQYKQRLTVNKIATCSEQLPAPCNGVSGYQATGTRLCCLSSSSGRCCLNVQWVSFKCSFLFACGQFRAAGSGGGVWGAQLIGLQFYLFRKEMVEMLWGFPSSSLGSRGSGKKINNKDDTVNILSLSCRFLS